MAYIIIYMNSTQIILRFHWNSAYIKTYILKSGRKSHVLGGRTKTLKFPIIICPHILPLQINQNFC